MDQAIKQATKVLSVEVIQSCSDEAVSAPNYCGGPLARRSGFQSNRAPPLRPFVSGRTEGNPDLSFSFSRYCSVIRNNGRNTNAACISASPIEGAFCGADRSEACECASRVAAIHEADSQGGGSMETWADDNAPYDFRKSFKKSRS